MTVDDKDMKALVGEATQGPWDWSYGEGNRHQALIGSRGELVVEANAYYALNVVDADAQFIAEARDWVPDTLDRLDQLRDLHTSEDTCRTIAHYPRGKHLQMDDCRVYCRACGHRYPCETRRLIDGGAR